MSTGSAGSTVDIPGRWVLLVALLGLGFSETWANVLREQAEGAGSAVLLAPVVGAVLTAVTLRLRHRPGTRPCGGRA